MDTKQQREWLLCDSKPKSDLVQRIVAAKKEGLSDKDIAAETDKLNALITLDDLHLLYVNPRLRYHYNHAIAKISWNVASEMRCDIKTTNVREDVMKDVINGMLDVIRLTSEMNMIGRKSM